MPLNHVLGVGFTSGRVLILDSITLEDKIEKPCCYTHKCVTHIAFSDDSYFCGYAVSNRSYITVPTVNYVLELTRREYEAIAILSVRAVDHRHFL